MTKPLHIKYRPQDFDTVLGQDAVVKSLSKLLKSGHVPHAFLFTGPSGVGKTTLARILAYELKCSEANLLEVDAATNTGIDNMRQVLEHVRYRGFGESSIRFVIVDECHALSKATWQSLLLSLEQPPEHVYWALCTTEPDKVPNTILTRCHNYKLNPIKQDELYAMLEHVRDTEKLDVSDPMLDLAVRNAQGSMRRALVSLSMLDGVESKEEALTLLQRAEEQTDAIQLARLLVQGQGLTWERAAKLLTSLENENAESIRLMITKYATKALLSAPKGKPVSEREATRLLNILSAFSSPCNSSEGLAPILLAVGSLLFE